jgi:hypothetical protein
MPLDYHLNPDTVPGSGDDWPVCVDCGREVSDRPCPGCDQYCCDNGRCECLCDPTDGDCND